MEQLILFRLLQGLGAGAVMPIATTIVGDIYSTKERAKVQGYLSSIWGISAILGPAIGGGIVYYFSWEYVFWVNIPLGILAMIGIGVFLHEPEREKEVSIDYKGAALLTVSLSAILFWLVEGGQSFGRLSLSSIALLLIGFGLFILFVVVERTAKDPLMPFSIWKNPGNFICEFSFLYNWLYINWNICLFTDICNGCYGATSNYCGIYVDSNVYWLANSFIFCGTFINSMGNI